MDSGDGDGPGRATGEDPKAEKSRKRQLKREEKELKRQRKLEQERREHEIAQVEEAQRRAAFERKKLECRQWMVNRNLLPDNFDVYIERLDFARRLFDFTNFFHVFVLNQQEDSTDANAMLGRCVRNGIECAQGIWSALMHPESQAIIEAGPDSQLYQNLKNYADAWDTAYQELESEVNQRRRPNVGDL